MYWVAASSNAWAEGTVGGSKAQNRKRFHKIASSTVWQILEDNGYPVIERDIARSELYNADEIFMCGTAAEVVPVREVDDHPLGEPGEVTKMVQARYEDAIYGRAPEYHEWLDLVGEPEPAPEPSKVKG